MSRVAQKHRPTGDEETDADLAEGTKDRVLRIAADLFATKGYDATGIQELSTATGLGRGALYYHIGSKEQLLFEITTTLLDDIGERSAAIVASERPAEEKVRLLARELLNHIADNRVGWLISMRELLAFSEAHRRRMIRSRDEYEGLWTRVFEQGAAEGTMRPVTPVLRRGIVGLLNTTHLWISRTGPRTPTEIADEYVDLMLDGLILKK